MTETTKSHEETRPARPLGRPGRALLRLPLFYKILIANVVVVAAVAATSAAVAAQLTAAGTPRGSWQLVVLIAAWGVLVTVFVNGAIVWVALRPLKKLEQTAWRVQGGDLEARAELSPVADRDLERLVLTFNGMLDTSEAYRQRLREVAARGLAAAEEERRRIAAELHDGTAQVLAGLRVRLRLARATQDTEVREAQLEQVSREIGEAIEEVRRMAKGLRPPALDVLGLAPAIESYARPLAEAAAIDPELHMELVDGVLPPDTELALYRILQEALSNVVRHSGASSVRIRLERRGGRVTLEIEDDGRGFDVDGELADRTRGLGLFGMQERAAYVGGRVSISSTPGRGTLVSVAVPTAEASRYA